MLRCVENSANNFLKLLRKKNYRYAKCIYKCKERAYHEGAGKDQPRLAPGPFSRRTGVIKCNCAVENWGFELHRFPTFLHSRSQVPHALVHIHRLTHGRSGFVTREVKNGHDHACPLEIRSQQRRKNPASYAVEKPSIRGLCCIDLTSKRSVNLRLAHPRNAQCFTDQRK